MIRSLPMCLLCSMISACNPQPDQPTDPPCLVSEVTVTPLALEFGDVPIGRPQILEIEVLNSGCFEFELQSLDIRPGSSPAFSIASEFEPQPIRVSQRVVVQMQFYSATQGAAAGALDIVTDIRVDGVKTVSFTGTGT